MDEIMFRMDDSLLWRRRFLQRVMVRAGCGNSGRCRRRGSPHGRLSKNGQSVESL